MDSSLIVDLLDSVLRCEVLRLPFPFTSYISVLYAKAVFGKLLPKVFAIKPMLVISMLIHTNLCYFMLIHASIFCVH